MNVSEYQAQMARLKARYGEKAYDQDFAKLLWRDVQRYPDGAFTRTVDAIVGEHFRPIGKAAIVEIMKQESAKRGGVRTSRIEPDDCPNCMGDGLLMLYKNDCRYVFSCGKCRNGQIQREISGAAAPHEDIGHNNGYGMRVRR